MSKEEREELIKKLYEVSEKTEYCLNCTNDDAGIGKEFHEFLELAVDFILADRKAHVTAVLDRLEAAAPKDTEGLRYVTDVDGDKFLKCPIHGGFDECDCEIKNEQNQAWRTAIQKEREGLK